MLFRSMGALLVNVHPGDPLTIAGAATLCLATAALGCLRPALEAVRSDPLVALRSE